MPWNGVAPNQSFGRTDGTRTGDTTWNQANAAGVMIVTSGHDAHDTDVKDAINATLKKDGGNTATANIPMGGYTLTNIANAAARTSPASFADVADNKGHYVGTVGGTADAITLTPTVAIAAYAAGQRFQFLASGTNTTGVTVNVSGVGVKDIKNRDAAFTALAAGAIVVGTMQDIEYDGTRFQYISGLATDSPQFAAINIGHATDTTVTRTAAGLIAVEGVAVKIAGRETVWMPAGAMIARTTLGAAVGVTEMATNRNMFKTLDFDTATQEFAQFEIFFPKAWNLGTLTFQPVWSHAATTVNFGAVWALEAVARSDADAGDVAFGTAQTSTDTGGVTNTIYIAPESAAITIAGTPTLGDTVQFQIKRVPADAADTLAVDARLHGIRLFFTTNAATDI